MGRRRKRQDKEEMAEECCFFCKDGGYDLRVCDYENCPKAYHPKCMGNDDGQFICDWHKCLNCRGSSDYQCLCCPVYSVCNACIRKVEFVQLKNQNKGFCSMCLNRAILIEKNADADPDVAETDHEDAEIGKILFKDYWEVIKDRERLSLVDLEEASVLLNRRLNCKGGVNSEKCPDDYHKSDENILPDNDTNDETIPSDSKPKQNKVNTSLKSKLNRKTYVGWASEELIEFMSSFSRDTAKPLDDFEIARVVKEYIEQKNLYQDDKKLCFFCDDKLQPLFTRRKVRCKMIRRFLEVHLASNEISDGSEDDDTPVMKRKPQSSLEPKIAKRVSERSKRCFASLVPNNINLIYLRKTLVVSLLSQPDTFEQKVVGCFVRFKIPWSMLSMDCYRNSSSAYMLGRVAGIKKSSKEYKINDTYTNVLLCVTGLCNDVNISQLSDEDFVEDECNDLISLVKKGLLERATIAEFKEKVATVHGDIVNHWIGRELVKVERKIDRAHIKGWHVEMEELLQQKKLLSTPAERQRRLEEIPEIVPDTEYEEKEIELEVATSNSSQENRGKIRGRVCFMDVEETSKGAAQQVANPLNDLKEEPPKGAAADAVECLKVLEKPPEGAGDQVTDSLNILNEESSEGRTHQVVDSLSVVHNGEPQIERTEGSMKQIPNSLNLLNKESPEVASKQGDATREAPSEAPEACFSGAILDPSLHSQMHDTQDDSPTQAIDVDRKESDHSRQVVMTKDKEIEVINLDSDEDEDLPTVRHKLEGNTVHAQRARNGGNILIERSKSASPATLHAQRGVNGDVLLEQWKSAPASMNGVLQPELHQPAPVTMNGVLPPEQREPAPAAMNTVLHPEQCKPAPAAKNGVSPHELLWHYVDPQGDTRGPFALVHLSRWKRNGFFNEDFRVWRTGQKAEQGILLTDAFRIHL